MIPTRREALSGLLFSLFFPLWNLLNNLRRRVPSPEIVTSPPMIETPRLSWKYRPYMLARVGQHEQYGDDTVLSRAYGTEMVLFEYHGMPDGPPYADGSQSLLFGFSTIEFYRGDRNWCEGRPAISLASALYAITCMKARFELTDAERDSLDSLVKLITPGHEIDQRPPISRQQFIVEWSSERYENGSQARGLTS